MKKYILENYPCLKCANLEKVELELYRLGKSPIGKCVCNTNIFVWNNSGCKTGKFKEV